MTVIRNGASHMVTASGRYFPIGDVTRGVDVRLQIGPEDIYIPDVIHALSNLCRFSGQLQEFYSVAAAQLPRR